MCNYLFRFINFTIKTHYWIYGFVTLIVLEKNGKQLFWISVINYRIFYKASQIDSAMRKRVYFVISMHILHLTNVNITELRFNDYF